VDTAALRELTGRSPDAKDRAFIDAMIRMEWSRTSDPALRAELEALHAAVREIAMQHHAPLRTRIASGSFPRTELRTHFDLIPVFERDHFVEEVLGVAYPPLEPAVLERELVTYTPSGYDEIVHAFDVSALGPDDRFIDVGSGMGKAVMLAALLTGATSTGLECDARLHALATHASSALGLAEVRFHHGDARDSAVVEEEHADVVFMYLPFSGRSLETVLDRLMEVGRRRPARSRGRFLCAGALDTSRYEDLVEAGPSRSWLHVYAWRSHQTNVPPTSTVGST
jgi:SAM-dependent methyltransferase